jgi:hypothetical protein
MRLPFNLHPKITSNSATAIVVSLLPLVYFWPATRGRLVISPDDGVIFNIPIRATVANIIRSGSLPLWNPYMFSGMPLFGAAQAGVLFPLNWFYLIFRTTAATNLMMLSTYVVAALGAYLYARRSGSTICGAALTSMVWQGCGFSLGQIGHTNILHTAAMLPWVLWAVDGYGSTGKRSRGLLLALLVALQLFAGHQQTFVYSTLLVAGYAIVMWLGSRKQGDRSSGRAYLRSLVFVAGGLALAAVQIIPMAELLRHSVRAQSSYSFFTSFSLPPSFLWTFFAPYVFGGGDGNLFRAAYVGPAFYGEYVGYVGLASLALAFLAIVFKRDLTTKFWWIVVVLGLMLAFGRFWPFHMYAVIYYTPVLGLFRVPARHLMEVEFALAVLSGRGLTALMEAGDRSTKTKWALATGGVIVIITCLAVTLGRPANFQLGRTAPLSILRAPELFLPIVVALISAWALWKFARSNQRGAMLILLVVIGADLCIWGQSSGWRMSSPSSNFELWTTPPIVDFIRGQNASAPAAPFRVLTDERSFDPSNPGDLTTPPGWVPTLQPDIYSPYRVENAAGYDGFGLARYSKLAGDMKVWGELTDPGRTLGNASREIDLLNVRYLLARRTKAEVANAFGTSPITNAEFPPATQVYDGVHFGEQDLSQPAITANQRLKFALPAIEADQIALLTNLAWSELVPNGTVVGRVKLYSKEGKTTELELRAGEHTSEWSYDRPDISARIKHKRAVVASSYEVSDAKAKYQAHNYVCVLHLSEKQTIAAGEITVAKVPEAPELLLSVTRIALGSDGKSFPLRPEWVVRESAATQQKSPEEHATSTARWERTAEFGSVVVYENKQMLSRAWLVANETVLSDEDQLNTIRTGKTPAGKDWLPQTTALVESSSGLASTNSDGPVGKADVTRNQPNQVEIQTENVVPAILILSANHYPGWQAQVDGHTADVIRVNYNLRGVLLPAGRHQVAFVYRPRSVLIGGLISLLTLAGLVVWWKLEPLRQKRS